MFINFQGLWIDALRHEDIIQLMYLIGRSFMARRLGKDSTESHSPGSPPATTDALQHAKPGRILFVDEEPGFCDLAVPVIECLGHSCKAFTSLLEALEWLESNPASIDIAVGGLEIVRQYGLLFVAAVGQIREDLPVVLCVAPGTRLQFPPPRNLAAVVEMPLDGTGVGKAIRDALALAPPSG